MSYVSIIIPVFNSGYWLSSTLNSCLQQIFFIKEIIIVDDFSEDNSWSIMQEFALKYPSLIKIFKNQIKGGNNARNFGFSKSTGEYIQWLDADDQLIGYKLELQLKSFDKSTDVIYSDWILNTFQNDILVRKEYKKNKKVNDFLYHLLIDNWSTPHAYLMKRGIAEKLHKELAWNPETEIFQDREYFTMAAIYGGIFKYTPGYFAVYNRWNNNSVSRNKDKSKRYQSLQNIFNRFENAIISESCISSNKKKYYLNVLDTQRVLAIVDGYPMPLKRVLNLFSVHWRLMPGFKTTYKFITIILFNQKKIIID